jgi:hypothetical protein
MVNGWQFIGLGAPQDFGNQGNTAGILRSYRRPKRPLGNVR